MYYEVEDGRGHLKAGLKHSPFQAIVAPRPIGWISTISKEGLHNLSPFSYFNAISSGPPAVMFTASGDHMEGGAKDTLANARDIGQFVCNLSTEALLQQMNNSSTAAPRSIDEFDVAGLTKAPSRLVKPARVAESPVHMECEVIHIMKIPLGEKSNSHMVMGRVLAVHIKDEFITPDGRFDTVKARPLGRLGYFDYNVVSDSFELLRPGWPLGTKPTAGGGG